MASDFDLSGKVILVTGAGDGIGKAVSLAAAKAGATLILLGKTVRKLESVYDQIIADGGQAPAIYPLNLEGATLDDYAALADVVTKEFGQLDGLLINAARAGQHAPIAHANMEHWLRTIHCNINGNAALIKSLLPLLQNTENSTLVFSSNPDILGAAYSSAYGVSKAAQIALADTLAKELENDDVRVVKVEPGRVNTSFSRQIYPGMKPVDLGDVESCTPLYLEAFHNAKNGTTLSQN